MSPEPISGATRIATVDLLRGAAVLGILAVNIAGFAGPIATSDTPALAFGAVPAGGAANEAVFAATFLIFEGKMRAIFSLLFGASMLLFIDAAECRGRNGDLLQLRRLGWLALFGYGHFLLLWWGDILFTYALTGCLALALRRVPVGRQVALALVIFFAWHGAQALGNLPLDLAEAHVRAGGARLAERQQVAQALGAIHAGLASDLARDQAGFATEVARWWARAPLWPLMVWAVTVGETLPLMLLGMALFRTGFFSGVWPAARLRGLAVGGIGLGGAWTLALLGWAWPRHFPPVAMPDVVAYWAGPAHLAMALGYLALAMRWMPRLVETRLGQRLIAAGRCAFSNYLGTSLVMAALFHGWGLGLEGRVGRLGQAGFVALGWGLMLAWSKPWLATYAQGPLEWAWRSLTEWRLMPMRR